MMRVAIRVHAVLFCLALTTLLPGCNRGPVPKGHYSGKFQSINSSDHDIFMKSCTGFGWASPDAGILLADNKSNAGLSFDPIPSIPESTTITWEDRTTGEEFSQSVTLKGVVPQGVEGVTEFEFGPDYQWTVRFVPAKHSP